MFTTSELLLLIVFVFGVILASAIFMSSDSKNSPTGEITIKVKLEDGTYENATINAKEFADTIEKAKRLFRPKTLSIKVKLGNGTYKEVSLYSKELAEAIEKAEHKS